MSRDEVKKKQFVLVLYYFNIWVIIWALPLLDILYWIDEAHFLLVTLRLPKK